MDTDVVVENLVELLTNTVNMTSVFYDLFLNPTPMDVELEQYDDNNDLITVTIPNRAKDRKIALEGEGSPEGVVIAVSGTAYVDTVTTDVYFKVSDDNGSSGWVLIFNQRRADELEARLKGKIAILKYSSEDTYSYDEVVADIIDNRLMFYRSLIDNNQGNPLSDTSSWEDMNAKEDPFTRNIGEMVASTIPLSDATLHLLDGALISGSGSYSAFVSYMADLYEDNPNASYFTTEAAWQQSVINNGVCGKFVYDSENNTVRLPKITGFIEGGTSTSVLGDFTKAGLPNITGYVSMGGCYVDSCTGAFVADTTTSGEAGTPNGKTDDFFFDASRSNSIYGGSSTVQPQSVNVLFYVVIANGTKTTIEVDIDEIATDLNGKADVDLSNLSGVGENHFLNKRQITNCILESPNGVATYSGGTVSVKSGLKVLIPNGRNTDNTLKNIEYTLSSDVSYTIENSSGALTANFDIYIFLQNDGTLSWSVLHDTYYGKSYPTVSTSYAYFYNSDENKWYLTQDTGSTWNQITETIIARASVQFNNSQYATIQSLTPYNTLELLGNKDKNEISGWGLPSSRKISITLGASGSEYTAPANGWFACILDMGTEAVLVNETTYLGSKNISFDTSIPEVLRCFVPVKRGHRVAYSWMGSPTTNTLYFIYANGDT